MAFDNNKLGELTCSSARSSARNSTVWMWQWTRSGEGLDSMRFSGG